MTDLKPVLNVANVTLQEQRHGERFVVKKGRMGPAIGLTKLGCTLHVVPAGKTLHQIVNTGTEEMRYLGISTLGSVVRPDRAHGGIDRLPGR
jgi:uncharacterized cupin superfamily protein